MASNCLPCGARVANFYRLQQGVDVLMPITLASDEHVSVLLAQFGVEGELLVVWLGDG